MAWPIIAPIAAAGITALGSYMGNRAARQESKRSRTFQAKMRSSQWQAAVADMEAAGLNPALAYQQGPGSSLGGAMAQQSDPIGGAVSSAMHARRLHAELDQIEAGTQKLKSEKRVADYAADMSQARLAAYGVERTGDGSIRFDLDPGHLPRMTREIDAAIALSEARGKREGLTGDIMQPLADLSDRLGELLPILGLISQLSPGGIVRGFNRRKNVPLKSRRVR